MFGKNILNNAYPFYRGILNLRTDNNTICLPILKLAAANMQIDDLYLIMTLNEVNLLDTKNRINFLDYQLIESDVTFKEQFELFKKIVQEKIAITDVFKFKVIERVYILNNQNINCDVL
jgi:hypothetical protein